MASTVEKRVHPPPSTPRILPILYSLTQNAVGSSGPNSTVADGAARSASSVSDFGAGKPFPMGQSQLQDYSYRWSGGHEETDRDRAGGSYRRLGRGRIFRSPEMGRTECLSARGGPGAHAHGRQRGSFRGFRRTPPSAIPRPTLCVGAETASGRGLRAIYQRNRIRL